MPPIASPGGRPVYPGDDDLAGIPTTPVAPSGGRPVYPDNTIGRPGFPTISFPVTYPTVSGGNYYSRVRFLNASTSDRTLDVYIDDRNVFSGSEFATISSYIRVTDGFHTVTVRRTNGQIYYQQTIAFVSGERLTMVILDTVSGVSLTRVSDMGCTNVPAGYGCLRVANMSYAGSSYDVRTFNNQTAFAGVGYKEVTSYKQTSSGTYTFFVTGSQYAVSALGELPVLVLSPSSAFLHGESASHLQRQRPCWKSLHSILSEIRGPVSSGRMSSRTEACCGRIALFVKIVYNLRNR